MSKENTRMSAETEHASESASWIRRHKTRLGLGLFAVAGAISLTQSADIKDDLIEAGKWVAPAIAVTETVAWSGCGMMVLAAGKKIGNPLTVKSRLKEVAQDVVDNKLYKRGWIGDAAGSIGTSVVIAAGAVTSLPKESWPLAFAISGASLGFSSLSLPYNLQPVEAER